MGKKVFFGINNTYIRSNQLLRIVYVVFEYNVYTFNTVEDSSCIPLAGKILTELLCTHPHLYLYTSDVVHQIAACFSIVSLINNMKSI